MTDMTDKKGFYMEENIINSLKSLLLGRVNEILGEGHLHIPPIDFGGYSGGPTIVPVISLSACERSEKERIVRLDAYSLTITFTLPEMVEGELFCYGYAAAMELALMENPALDGVANRAVIIGKQYRQPKTAHCGEGWAVSLSLRITVEGMGYAG
jgi:hypothetical protein